MHFNSKLILTLLYSIPSTLAAVNGGCTGRDGICISTANCSKYGGQSFTGKCPNDANDIKCCDDIPCKADDGRTGYCMFTNQCGGEGISGKCPGGSNFKCCVPKKVTNTPCSYEGLSGVCKNVSECTGFRVAGLCPGDANNQCCLPKNTCSDGGVSGQCLPVSQCGTGYTVSGKCPGGNGIKCCLPKPVVTNTPCSYEGLSGTCKNVNECTGFRVSGLCPGDASNQCCLPKNTCSDGTQNGQCLPVSQCSTGYTVSGKCPGGNGIKCCLPKPPNSSTTNPPTTNPSTTSSVSEFKKAYGSIISEYARKNSIDENVLGAFILVESSGSGFVNGKLKIRFENHIFLKGDAAQYKGKYFDYSSEKSFKGHVYRKNTSDPWKECHTNQSVEYDAFNFAITLNAKLAYEATSYGLPQIMGFNYAVAGYSSAQEMYTEFGKGEDVQIRGFINFITSYSSGNLLKACQQNDYEKMVSLYNGSGNVSSYKQKLIDNIEYYKNA